MKKLVLLTMALALLAGIVLAADVSGKWVAQMPGRDGATREVNFAFKVDGEKLTGSQTSPMGEREISNGTVKGDDIAFDMVFEFNGNTMKMKYSGKIAGDEIKMKYQREGGEQPAREFTMKRAQ